MTLLPDASARTEAVEALFLRLRPGARLPALQTPLASGYDLHACIDAPVEVGTMPVRIPCGFAMAVPEGTDVQVRPRSGLSAKGVLAVLGTLDADYRGELMVMLYCLPGAAPYVVQDGDRIAQLVVSRLAPVEWREVDTLDETQRGAGGYGSTGVR
ncbi:MAG: dUTP diphosphatase [Chloroflexi bacterium]|nr:dUTP diphosphatase [Chloroflexota bacterium]MDA1240631.1 dUTP diphosphatase [Chloroflexota bacterium]